MAKNDEDIVDFLMHTLLQILGWIFMGIFKLAWIIIAALFNGIVSLFKKGDSDAESSGTKAE